jgi:sugar phosphate isomerase/epimerase
MEKSIVLPAFFPDTINSIKSIKGALDYLLQFNIKWIEFYYTKGKDKKLKKLLSTYDYNYIYLGAMHAKLNNLNISYVNDSLREKSVEELKTCIDNAKYYGANRLLINSGRKPDEKKHNKKSYQLLMNSLDELNYYNNIINTEPIVLTLEPGDDNIDSFSLIGNSDLALNLVQKLKYLNLTLDISHILQLEEDPYLVIKKCFENTDHIHLANCVIHNKNSKLYGDKHPMFDENEGELSTDQIIKIFDYIKENYKNKKIIIGLEVINSEDTGIRDLNKYKNKLDWFLKS